MEPRIQYAKTKDGVSIAFWTLGEGAPLVMTPAPGSPSLRAWTTPEGRRFFELLAQNRWLIRYDNRGVGDSQREVPDESFDALVADLEAVVDHLGLDRFALIGYAFSAPYAIAYAVRHPARVGRLILWSASSRGEDFFNMTRLRTARQALDADPDFFLEVILHEAFGWTGSEQARRWMAAVHEDANRDLVIARIESIVAADVTDLLPQVTVPTLVLQRRHLRFPSLDAARRLAAHIPNARLVVLEGESGLPYLGDIEPVIQAVDEFLGEGEHSAAASPSPSGLVTILFTDMESSTALTQRLGDAGAQEVRRAHNAIVRDALRDQGGSEIKHTGDGIMASFPSASGALECAIAIQRGVAARKEEHPDSPLGVYVGLNAGEPIAEDDDLFGTSVDLAARICDHAQPGQIVASDVVRQLAAGKNFLFADLGETELRGFEDPVRLYDVRWRET